VVSAWFKRPRRRTARPATRHRVRVSWGQRFHNVTNRMRQICTSGSVGALGGQSPWATRQRETRLKKGKGTASACSGGSAAAPTGASGSLAGYPSATCWACFVAFCKQSTLSAIAIPAIMLTRRERNLDGHETRKSGEALSAPKYDYNCSKSVIFGVWSNRHFTQEIVVWPTVQPGTTATISPSA
jgi:hypothetical protein